MPGFKIVIGTKSGKCVQKEIAEDKSNVFLGKIIGDSVSGDDFDLQGYEFQITGGTDFAGFPMRRDVSGPGRKKILAVEGIGMKKKGHGVRQRRTVCGNMVNPRISQINLKVIKEGAAPLIAPEAAKEEQPAEQK